MPPNAANDDPASMPRTYEEAVMVLQKLKADILGMDLPSTKPQPLVGTGAVLFHALKKGRLPPVEATQDLPLPTRRREDGYTQEIRHELPSLRAARPRRGRMHEGKGILLAFSRRTAPEA